MPELLTSRPAGDALRALAPKFNRLGYYTTEEVAAAASGAEKAMAKYLGMSRADLAQIIAPAYNTVFGVPYHVMTRAETRRALGRLKRSRPIRSLRAGEGLLSSNAGSVPNKSLTDPAHPVKNQANRGTCTVFSSLAAYERALALKSGTAWGTATTPPYYPDLSEQDLAWLTLVSDPMVDASSLPTGERLNEMEGWAIVQVMDVLKTQPMVDETVWPYTEDFAPNSRPVTVAGGTLPPASLAINAICDDLHATHSLISYDICCAVDDGNYVVVGFPLFLSSFNKAQVLWGAFMNPFPSEKSLGGHAVCIVGYEKSTQEGLGGGRFQVRNSWGDTWGFATDSEGYGMMPYRYIDQYADEAIVITV